MAAFNRRTKKEEKLNTLQDEGSGLKSDIGEIKNLLKSLLHGDNNAS
jgi:conjugal transfer/entry exclusion protein